MPNLVCPICRKPWDVPAFRVGTVGVCPKVESLDSYRQRGEVYWERPMDHLLKTSAGSVPMTVASGAVRP